MKEKNPLTLWIIVGVCFSIVVITWIPLAIQRVSDLFGSLGKQTKVTSEDAKALWDGQAKQQIDNFMRQLSQTASTTEQNQGIILDFSESFKNQLLQNASSSATTSLVQ